MWLCDFVQGKTKTPHTRIQSIKKEREREREREREPRYSRIRVLKLEINRTFCNSTLTRSDISVFYVEKGRKKE